MKTQQSMPSRAACAATLLARLPVDAREHVEPELDRPRRPRPTDAVLVGQRRVVHRVILYI
jgi:hypothetical protein